ncbi:DUF6660 family protein [Daejeonella rubra]|uniref:DUF6660 family protein n=1 Tax=Daejeonella rubra TaxID=990371 RepID=UPI0038993227
MTIAILLHGILSYICNLMRSLTFIMAIMVLVLSCIPCAEAEVFAGKYESKTLLFKSDTQNLPINSDACSPFCTCSCCLGFSIAATVSPSFSLMYTCRQKIYSSYYPKIISSISLSIWQPPQ